jgi:hypothetical protein
LAGAVVVVAKQVAEPVHGEAFKFAVQVATACAAAGGLHRNHDVAEKDPIARWIGFAFELLHVKAQHVGGAIETAELAIECTDLIIAGEQQGSRRARAPELAQGRAQSIRDHTAGGRADQAAGIAADHDIDGHGRDDRRSACPSPRPTTCGTS